jgi:hypothetical protein
VDMGVILSHFGRTGSWGEGDVNYEGHVDLVDWNALHSNYSSPAICDSIPNLSLAGASIGNQGEAYTLTISDVAGATVQTYLVDWGDGSTPQSYTAAEINALNRQLTHTFASSAYNPIITLTLIDDQSRMYLDLVAKHVGIVIPTSLPNIAPIISNFYCINDYAEIWTLTGTVTDFDDPVLGDTIVFGGVLAGHNLTATVGTDGVFCLTAELRGLQEGTGTAQTSDPHGALSNLAEDWVIPWL